MNSILTFVSSYCPNETNDDRLIFKNYFNLLVDQRARNLIKAGREVIVVGDLASAPSRAHVPSD